MKHPVLELRPTQFAVGMREVEKKAKKFSDFSKDDLRDYLRDHPAPVVQAAHDELHLIDHHHLARACWEIGLEEIHVEIKADFSHLSEHEFWIALDHSHWSHLYDQFGRGPHDYRLLPDNVRGLSDDPFRSLAWDVRREGGYDKTDQPFAEFEWAQYLRNRLTLLPGDDGYKATLKKALEIARSAEAGELPGSKNAKPSSFVRRLKQYFRK